MRVYDQNLNGAAAAQTGSAQEAQRTARAGSPGANSVAGFGDRVEFSNTLSSLSRALEADGSARAIRVQELAAQYRSGAYHPDSAATSRAMLTDALGPAAG